MWCQQQDDSVTWFSLLLRATSCESPATWWGRERNLSELRERTVWTRDMLTRDLASTNWKYQRLIWSSSVDNEVRWRWLITTNWWSNYFYLTITVSQTVQLLTITPPLTIPLPHVSVWSSQRSGAFNIFLLSYLLLVLTSFSGAS